MLSRATRDQAHTTHRTHAQTEWNHQHRPPNHLATTRRRIWPQCTQTSNSTREACPLSPSTGAGTVQRGPWRMPKRPRTVETKLRPATHPCQLRVGASTRTAPSVLSAPRLTRKCGVDGQLMQGEAIGDNLLLSTLTCVTSKSLSITLVRPLAPASLQTLAAALSSGKLPPKNPRCCTCRPVVAKGVEWTATPARRRGRWTAHQTAPTDIGEKRLARALGSTAASRSVGGNAEYGGHENLPTSRSEFSQAVLDSSTRIEMAEGLEFRQVQLDDESAVQHSERDMFLRLGNQT